MYGKGSIGIRCLLFDTLNGGGEHIGKIPWRPSQSNPEVSKRRLFAELVDVKDRDEKSIQSKNSQELPNVSLKSGMWKFGRLTSPDFQI